MVVRDFNKDGNLDIAMTGNDYGAEVFNGRLDALQGLVLIGNGKGKFFPMSIEKSGLYLPGNGKSLIELNTGSGNQLLVAGQNRGALKAFLENK